MSTKVRGLRASHTHVNLMGSDDLPLALDEFNLSVRQGVLVGTVEPQELLQ